MKQTITINKNIKSLLYMNIRKQIYWIPELWYIDEDINTIKFDKILKNFIKLS